MNSIKVLVPTSVDMGNYKVATAKNKIGDKKKPFSLNMNVFRNTSSFLIKQADVNFRKYVSDNFPELASAKFKQVMLLYTIRFGNNRNRDLANVAVVIDKFFSDTLTEMGVLEDDNYSIIPIILYQGFKDIGNEICEIEIIDIDNLTNKEIGAIISKRIKVKGK